MEQPVTRSLGLSEPQGCRMDEVLNQEILRQINVLCSTAEIGRTNAGCPMVPALFAPPPPPIVTGNQSHFWPRRMEFKGWIEDYKQCRVHRGLAENDPRRVKEVH